MSNIVYINLIIFENMGTEYPYFLSTISNIHRDFETITHISCSWFCPHSVLLLNLTYCQSMYQYYNRKNVKEHRENH